MIVSTSSQTSQSPKKELMIESWRHTIPLCGMGTMKIVEKKPIVDGLLKGLRLIDTAKAYHNEEVVGAGIVESGIDPQEIIIITKLFNENLKNKEMLYQAIADSKKKIGKTPEFFLVHGPYPDVSMVAIIQELESMKKIGFIKDWGVSNFDVEHLQVLKDNGQIPALNQVECHPYFQRKELLEFCKKNQMTMQAYRPIIQGRALEDATIKKIAQIHSTTPARVIYSWLAQQEVAILTTVNNPEHLKEYVESELISLSPDEIAQLESLNKLDGSGRTCTKGGWFVPFSNQLLKNWLSRLAESEQVF